MNYSKNITYIFVITIIIFHISTLHNTLIKLKNFLRNKTPTINWTELYPFSNPPQKKDISLAYKLTKIIRKVENLAEESLPFRDWLCETQAYINKMVGVKLFLEFDRTYFLNNGYMANNYPYTSAKTAVESITALYNFLSNDQINFCFILYPCKNCKYNPQLPQGIKDNNNQTADELLKGLKKRNISYLDMREELHKDYDNHYQLFYITDHHWKSQTGLWATRKIAKYLNLRFDYKMPIELLIEENFNTQTIPNAILGSQGQKVTKVYAEPEDLTILTPKFETYFYRECLTWGNTIGKFEDVMFENSHISIIDHYHQKPYEYFSNGDQALIKYQNHSIKNAKNKILIIRDSFSRVITPYLAILSKELIVVDPRYFNGSIESLIKSEKPDTVILAYEASCVSVGNSSRWKLK